MCTVSTSRQNAREESWAPHHSSGLMGPCVLPTPSFMITSITGRYTSSPLGTLCHHSRGKLHLSVDMDPQKVHVKEKMMPWHALIEPVRIDGWTCLETILFIQQVQKVITKCGAFVRPLWYLGQTFHNVQVQTHLAYIVTLCIECFVALQRAYPSAILDTDWAAPSHTSRREDLKHGRHEQARVLPSFTGLIEPLPLLGLVERLRDGESFACNNIPHDNTS